MNVNELQDRAEALLRGEQSVGDPAAWLGALGEHTGLAGVLDHTLLKPEASRDDILRSVDDGRRLGTATVCVNGVWVSTVAAALTGSVTGVAAVVGFPLGAMHPAAKAAEARQAVQNGATELDMVLSIGAALAGDWAAVEDDIAGVVTAAGAIPVKVILESAAVPLRTVAVASMVAAGAGARFVKTSTGFHAAGGASVEAVTLMRRAVGSAVGVKASGGIRTARQVLAMLAAGADRIGTSSSAAICDAPAAGTLLERVRAAVGAVADGVGGGYG